MLSDPLILASASPRRADLLRFAGVDINIIPTHIDESRHTDESPEEYVSRLALEKALAINHPGRLVLAADTTVFLADEIFDKPKDAADAKTHLRRLSGQTHKVGTSFCLVGRNGDIIKHQTVISLVTFRQLNETEINSYVACGEGFDKAGGYGLQGLGAFLVEKIEGSHTGVIGLPLSEVLQALSTIR